MAKKKFKKVEVNIPFIKFTEGEIFEGILNEIQESSEGDEYVIGITSDNKKVKLGGYQILYFFKNFYEHGKQIQISFKGKVQIKNGKSVNEFDILMEE